MSIFRRIFGLLLIVIGVVGLGIAGAGAYFSSQALDSVAAGLNSTFGLLGTTIGTTVESLTAVKTTLDEAQQTMATVTDTAGTLATTVADSVPFMDELGALATETVPGSLDAVSMAVPNLAAVAGTIDTALMRLSDLQVERSILGVPFSFDLGINYAPVQPFDEAVLQIGDSLVGVPEQLRSLQSSLNVAVVNLSAIGDNLSTLSGNLDGVTASMSQFGPLLDEYILVMDQTASTLEETRTQFNANLDTIKLVATALFVWFAFYQVLPIYFGWQMLTEREDDEEDEDDEQAGEEAAADRDQISDEVAAVDEDA